MKLEHRLSFTSALLIPAALAAQTTDGTGLTGSTGTSSSMGALRMGSSNQDGRTRDQGSALQSDSRVDTSRAEPATAASSRVLNPVSTELSAGTLGSSTSSYPSGSSPLTSSITLAATGSGAISAYPGVITGEAATDAVGIPPRGVSDSTSPATISTTPGSAPD